MKVWAPWVKVAVFADSDTIIVPGVDLVTVGRTIQLYNNKKAVDEHDSKAIWDRVTQVMPNLQK